MRKLDKRDGLIIIGGGLCGLSAGCTWAQSRDPSQFPAVILEKQGHTGGSVTTYKRRGFEIDTCQMFPDISDILSYFSIQLPMIRFDKALVRRFEGVPPAPLRTCTMPASRREPAPFFGDGGESRSFDRFLTATEKLYRGMLSLRVNPGVVDIIRILLRHREIVDASRLTWTALCDRFRLSPGMRGLLSPFVEMSSLPSSEVAALAPAAILHSLLDGAYRPARGFADLPRQLQARFEALGGEMRTNAEVVEILTSGGRVRGVRCADGRELLAGTVISAVDTAQTMFRLLGKDRLERAGRGYARKARAAEMSMSTFAVNVCLDDRFEPLSYGLDAGFHVLASNDRAFDMLYEACRRGEDALSRELFQIGISCSPPGRKPVLTLGAYPTSPAPWVQLRETDRPRYLEAKQARAELIMSIVESALIPDLSKQTLFVDIATPATYARYNGSAAIYDMSPAVSNFGATRLGMQTPVKGLYSPKFVHGIVGALVSGMQAVDAILGGAVMGGRARPGRQLMTNDR